MSIDSKPSTSSCPTCGDSVSPTAKKLVKPLICNRCGFEFSLVYARVFACQGCRQAVLNCPLVRCPKCGHEFYIGEINDVNQVLARYYQQAGISVSR